MPSPLGNGEGDPQAQPSAKHPEKMVKRAAGPKRHPRDHYAFKELSGLVFGRLTVIEWIDVENKNSRWRCLCECGRQCIVYGCHLKTRATTSCGCFASEQTSRATKTHGMSGPHGHPVYNIWKAMIRRCESSHCKEYASYGGRGIKVCERWRKSFPDFLSDMGERPTHVRHSIDRLDVNGNYEPGNCRWATYVEQANNKRNTKLFLHNGENKTVAQWARIYNISSAVIYDRLQRGYSMTRALTTPVRKNHRIQQNDGRFAIPVLSIASSGS